MMEREDKNKAKVGIHGVLVILCNFNNLINIFNLTKLDQYIPYYKVLSFCLKRLNMKLILSESSSVIVSCHKCVISDNFLQSEVHSTFHF